MLLDFAVLSSVFDYKYFTNIVCEQSLVVVLRREYKGYARGVEACGLCDFSLFFEGSQEREWESKICER